MKRVICPNCKSNNIIPIVYGYPTLKTWEEAEKGKLKLGGCEILIGCEQPDLYCKECKFEWSRGSFSAEDIVKIRFRYWLNYGCIDSELKSEGQWAFEVFKDGTIKYFAYPIVGRKVLDKDTVHIDKERVTEFYQNVIWLYRPWENLIICDVCDGYSYELTITYPDNRKSKLKGDIGGGTVDNTILSFLKSIPEMELKLVDLGEDEY